MMNFYPRIQKVVESDNYRPFFQGKKIQQNFKIPKYLMEDFLEFMKNQREILRRLHQLEFQTYQLQIPQWV